MADRKLDLMAEIRSDGQPSWLASMAELYPIVESDPLLQHSIFYYSTTALDPLLPCSTSTAALDLLLPHSMPCKSCIRNQ